MDYLKNKISVADFMALNKLLDRLVDFHKRTKLTYALDLLTKKWKKPMEEMNEKIIDVDYKYVSCDADGNIMRNEVTFTDAAGVVRKEDNGEFKYKPDNKRKRDAEVKAIYEKEIEIDTLSLSADEPSVAALLKQPMSHAEMNLLAIAFDVNTELELEK